MFKIVKVGKKEKMLLSDRYHAPIDFPSLTHVPLESYEYFLQAGVEPKDRENRGIQEVFKEIFPIQDGQQNLILEFLEYTLGLGRCRKCPGSKSIPEKPCLFNECYYDERDCEVSEIDGKFFRIKMLPEDCKRKDGTYAVPLQLRVQLINKQSGELKEQNIFICDLPIMTHRGTFIFNGAERVVVSQLHRSPGVFFSYDDAKKFYEAKVVPYRGAWMSFELDIMRDIIYTRLDRKRKVPVTALLRVLGFHDDKEILELFNNSHYIINTLKKDSLTQDKLKKHSVMRKAILDIFSKIRPGENFNTEEGALDVIGKLYFDPKRYDLDKVGRFKIRNKLCMRYKIRGKISAETIYDGKTGELITEPGEIIDGILASRIEKCDVPRIRLKTLDGRENIVTNDPDFEFFSFLDTKKKIENKLWGAICAKSLIDEITGEIVLEADDSIRNKEIAYLLESNIKVFSYYLDGKEQTINLSVYRGHGYLFRAKEEIHKLLNNRVLDEDVIDPNTKVKIFEQGEELTYHTIDRLIELEIPSLRLQKSRVLCKNDIVAILRYLIGLVTGVGEIDDIDHLGNRRVRRVGELLQNQFRAILSRIEREIKERMTINQDIESITPTQLINSRPIQAAVKDFFGTSQLSQFMDQTNPLSELTHKRRVSALGPGGLKRERAGFEVRDVHPTHFGRICPIETPEGPNAGLIGSLAIYARINTYGFIESPLMKVKDRKLLPGTVKYVDSHEEDGYIIAPPDVNVKDGYILDDKLPAKYVSDGVHEFSMVESELVNHIRISPAQMISVATSLIPFLEHDDANRALMGTNMQRQSVPLIKTETPLVGPGMEYRTALDSGVNVVSRESGTVRSIKGLRNKDDELVYEIEVLGDPKPGRKIINVKTNDKEFFRKTHKKVSAVSVYSPKTGELLAEANEAFDMPKLKKAKKLGVKELVLYNSRVEVYRLIKFGKSNQGTCINQQPAVKIGDHVEKGEVIADGHCVDGGELALGKNILVAFMSWEGYNFEDAILLSRRTVKEDIYTSIHIEGFDVEARDTKLGPEEITRDIPNISDEMLKNLDDGGIIRIGAKVETGDILVGKVTPKGVTELTAEDKLLRAIFGEKAREVRDTSFRVPHGASGVVVDVMVFDRKFKAELPHGVNKLVKVFIAQKRLVTAGDKMAGRHGNKGVIAKIFPEENMPYIQDGTPIDIVLNPLGVPSRMNVGQVFETIFGFGARQLGYPMNVESFTGTKQGITEKFVTIGKMIRFGKIKIFNSTNEKQVGWIKLFDYDKEGVKKTFLNADNYFEAMAKIFTKYTAQIVTLDEEIPCYQIKKIKHDVLEKALLKNDVTKCFEKISLLKKTVNFNAERTSLEGKDTFSVDIIDNFDEAEMYECDVHEYDVMPISEYKKTFHYPTIDVSDEEQKLLSDSLKNFDIYSFETAKQYVYDGRTGERYHHEVVVGDIYMMKLYHLVEDKIHARATGPYSLVTQQPLGGKAQFGGQRFGEMEVWAIEAYGAAHTLQEILTIKSDDVEGRVDVYEAITKNQRNIKPRVPESFKVLVNELRSLCLKTQLHRGDEHKELSEIEQDVEKLRSVPEMQTDINKLFKDN